MTRHAAPWGNRVVKTGTAKAGELLANPRNWRIHPKDQQDVLAGMLNEVGFVQGVVVNLRTHKSWGRDRNVETLVDGHLRAELALSRGEDVTLPCAYVDLLPSEEHAILASMDPIGAMAVTDTEKLNELVADMPEDLRALTEVLRQERKGTKTVTFSASEYCRVVVDCTDAGQQQELLQRLTSEGYTCRIE